MTREDLFRAIGAAEEKDLIQAQKKRIAPIVWIVAAAVVLLMLSFLIHRERPVVHSVLEEKPSWSMDTDILVTPEQILCVNTSYSPCELSFHIGLAVYAQVVEELPDTYLIPEKTLSRNDYRVLRMKTLDVIVGQDVPKEFWFLLPIRYDAPLLNRSFLMDLTQVGVEDYLLFNTTKQQYETFSIMFTANGNSREYDMEFTPDPTAVSAGAILSMLPFENGKLDWPQTEQWQYLQEKFEYFSGKENPLYPIEPDATLEEAKEAIRNCRETDGIGETTPPRVRYADEYNIGIRLTDTDTPKEGVFSQIIHQHDKKILLCRIIDGFYANECYMYYDDGRIEASDVQFTREDLAKLPKLTPVVEQVLKKAPEKGTCHILEGYYYKTDQGDLFGVVRAHWEINWETSVTVNMLVNCDGTVTQISTEELNQRLQGAR